MNNSPYKNWSRKERNKELGRLMDYVMDLDAEGKAPPPRIQKILESKSLSIADEDVLIAWSESNTPGYYSR